MKIRKQCNSLFSSGIRWTVYDNYSGLRYAILHSDRYDIITITRKPRAWMNSYTRSQSEMNTYHHTFSSLDWSCTIKHYVVFVWKCRDVIIWDSQVSHMQKTSAYIVIISAQISSHLCTFDRALKWTFDKVRKSLVGGGALSFPSHRQARHLTMLTLSDHALVRRKPVIAVTAYSPEHVQVSILKKIVTGWKIHVYGTTQCISCWTYHVFTCSGAVRADVCGELM